jgi:ABC-2 type transport system ATP-binding protein
MLQATNASKRFGRITAVDEVDLAVDSGQVLAFLGPNGAGKTTLMKMFLGLVRPSGGTLSIDGKPSGSPLSRDLVAYLPESLALPGWATPNVLHRHVSRLRSRPGSVQDLHRIAETMECRDLLDRSFGKMSRGQVQRCIVSVIASGRPGILLLDEPSAGLDPAGRVKLRNMLRSLAADGATVMINSHLLGEVERTCDTAAFINDGRLIAQGDLSELSRPIGSARVSSPEPELMANELSRRGYSVEAAERSVVVPLAADTGGIRELTADILETGLEFTGIETLREDLEQVFLRLTAPAGVKEVERE